MWRQQYDYDRWGNRTINQTATTGNDIPKPHFALDLALTNQLLAPSDVNLAATDPARLMRYDAAGNLVKDYYTPPTQAGVRGERVYDAENRLRQAWAGVPGASLLQGAYTYDGDGRRIARTTGGVTTWQVYGLEGELVAEYAAQAHALLPQKEYGYQNGKMLISAVNGDETRLRRFVENFYQRTWLTLPDQATLQNHINALAAQGLISHAAMLTHAQQFGASLFTSTTYLNRNTTNGMYVADLYLAYLQRPPDEGGFEYWKEVLDNNQISRATLRDAFAGVGYSPSEYGGILDALRASGVNDYDRVDRFVNYVYTATSGNGQTGPTVAQRDFERDRFDVAEAQNREAVRTAAEQLATELLGANANNYRQEWNDTEYVRRLYETFLRHAPDTAGWEYWAEAAEKQGRAGVLGAFLEAGAYREQADALYREIYWLVGDHLGTPRLIVSRTGSVASVKRHDYLPFGEELAVGAGGRATSQGYTFTGDSVRQQFTGYEHDDETGLDYAQARYYSPTQGRFTAVDPALASADRSLPQSWNRYSYTINNPLKFVDPSGMIWGIVGNQPTWYDSLEELQNAGATIFAPTNYQYRDGSGNIVQLDPTSNNWAYLSDIEEANLELAQAVISGLGMIPGAEPFDTFNAGMSLGRGNLGDSALDMAGNLGPLTGIILAKRVAKLRKLAKLGKLKNTDEILAAAKTLLKDKAGFASEGIPIIVDNSLGVNPNTLAGELRQNGINARSVIEIFGKDPGDPNIKQLAEQIGGRVLASDRGRDIDGGFGTLTIKNARQGLSSATYIRLINEAIK